MHVVEANTPIFLSIDDMDRFTIYLNNLRDQLAHQSSGLKAKVRRRRVHPFILWNLQISRMLTSIELCRLHRGFGLSSIDTFMKLLQCAEFSDVGPETRQLLKKIEKSCNPCQMYKNRVDSSSR